MAISRARIEDVLQRPVEHLAYPYGDKTAAGRPRIRDGARRPDSRPR